MKRTFKLECGMDLTPTLSIETDILTPQWAAEIARFWSNKDRLLDASDEDEYQAVARLAAPWLWDYMMHDGYHEQGALQELHKQEGWCIPGETLGITILDHDYPDMDPVYLEVEEIVQPTPDGQPRGSR